MSILILTTLIIIIAVLVAIIYYYLISYSTYVYMTKNSGCEIGKATYEQFKFRFERITEWEYKHEFEDSLFCYKSNYSYRKGYIHASQIIFDEKAMLLGRIDYFRAKLLIKKTTKQFHQEKVKPKTWEQIEAEEIIDKLK